MATDTNSSRETASMYYYGKDPRQTAEEQGKKIVAIAFPVVVVIILLLRLLCLLCVHKDWEEHDAAGGGNRSWGADRAPSSTTAASAGVDVAPAAVRAAEPPLVCTYRKADGWRDGSCGVCLADLADGEVLRVLPACMHYFHAACVGEWLRGHDTCPLCRAPAAPRSCRRGLVMSSV